VTELLVTIEGYDMPGRSCAPADAPRYYDNIHVGVQRGREPFELVPGDAPGATWTFPVKTKIVDDGAVDFGGPFVHGRRGERFLYLTWGAIDPDFQMFRRAKLVFADCPADVMQAALETGVLVCRVRMTDAKGNPRCARVRPPDAVWAAGQ
jgi:hypothetical protein